MQVAGSGADVLDVLRQDGSQELTGRGSGACGARAAAPNLPSVVPDPRHRGEARGHGRANDQLGLQVLSLRRSEEHTSELQSLAYLVCRLLLEKKKKDISTMTRTK